MLGIRGGGEIFRFFGWEVRCQENTSDIFGEKVRKRMKNLALQLSYYYSVMCWVIPSLRYLYFKDYRMLLIQSLN